RRGLAGQERVASFKLKVEIEAGVVAVSRRSLLANERSALATTGKEYSSSNPNSSYETPAGRQVGLSLANKLSRACRLTLVACSLKLSTCILNPESCLFFPPATA